MKLTEEVSLFKNKIIEKFPFVNTFGCKYVLDVEENTDQVSADA